MLWFLASDTKSMVWAFGLVDSIYADSSVWLPDNTFLSNPRGAGSKRG